MLAPALKSDMFSLEYPEARKGLAGEDHLKGGGGQEPTDMMWENVYTGSRKVQK